MDAAVGLGPVADALAAGAGDAELALAVFGSYPPYGSSVLEGADGFGAGADACASLGKGAG